MSTLLKTLVIKQYIFTVVFMQVKQLIPLSLEEEKAAKGESKRGKAPKCAYREF